MHTIFPIFLAIVAFTLVAFLLFLSLLRFRDLCVRRIINTAVFYLEEADRRKTYQKVFEGESVNEEITRVGLQRALRRLFGLEPREYYFWLATLRPFFLIQADHFRVDLDRELTAVTRRDEMIGSKKVADFLNAAYFLFYRFYSENQEEQKMQGGGNNEPTSRGQA